MAGIPNFLVVGAGKAGTAWLHLCLREHPQVFVPPVKEIHFFSYHYHKGFEWYRSFFRDCKGEKAVGELSPSYLVTPEVPERIRQCNPSMRLLFLLRNPVARAYSHYCMVLRAAGVSENLDAEIVPGSQFVTHGLYHSHLTRFLKHFPPEQIKVLLYDDLVETPDRFLRQAFAFLEVEPDFAPAALRKPFHARRARPRYQRLYNGLVRVSGWLSQRSALAARAIRGFRARGYAEMFHRLNQGPDFPPLSPETARRLAGLYREDVEALSRWLGRDLTHWVRGYL